MKKREEVKAELDRALAAELEPGERAVAASAAMIASGVWGPTSMYAKWCYVGVTETRVVWLSVSRWSMRSKGLWFEDRRAEVSIEGPTPGKLWSWFTYKRPDGSTLRVNFHRFWNEEMNGVLAALGSS